MGSKGEKETLCKHNNAIQSMQKCEGTKHKHYTKCTFTPILQSQKKADNPKRPTEKFLRFNSTTYYKFKANHPFNLYCNCIYLYLFIVLCIYLYVFCHDPCLSNSFIVQMYSVACISSAK
ncbi:hypothetical protein XELAEV_18026405mg [Xenopus laevis]|uniref:Uncharacterized protein n=1 Tax=Xenopus laevis TaxID=8355 RepID=A0A974CTQ8_XENLA|nr:hypothetical protein XELAEV_18026405mg [Xenopus laevis]